MGLAHDPESIAAVELGSEWAWLRSAESSAESLGVTRRCLNCGTGVGPMSPTNLDPLPVISTTTPGLEISS